MLHDTPVQWQPTTELPSGRLVTRPRKLNITFRPLWKENRTENLATNCGKKTVKHKKKKFVISWDEIFWNKRIHTFWPQKEWRNVGWVESRTSWRETKGIQIKLATGTCNMYELQQSAKNNAEPNGGRQLGKILKGLLDEADRDLSRPNSWRMVVVVVVMMMMMVVVVVMVHSRLHNSARISSHHRGFDRRWYSKK